MLGGTVPGYPAAHGAYFSSDTYLLCKAKPSLHRMDEVNSASRGNGPGTAFIGSDLYIKCVSSGHPFRWSLSDPALEHVLLAETIRKT